MARYDPQGGVMKVGKVSHGCVEMSRKGYSSATGQFL